MWGDGWSLPGRGGRARSPTSCGRGGRKQACYGEALHLARGDGEGRENRRGEGEERNATPGRKFAAEKGLLPACCGSAPRLLTLSIGKFGFLATSGRQSG